MAFTEFEELDYQNTAIGEISLRRRTEPRLGVEVYEVKLGDDFLMSSLFTFGETELARLGLAACTAGPLDIAVGGLGLGYTARTVLDHAAVRSLLVIDALPVVIDWHQRGLVPLGAGLSADPRCEFLAGDFYAQVNSSGMDPQMPDKRFHAILLDIDHSPRHVLHPANAAFYQAGGLRRLAAHLHPGGIFALWSNDPPDEDFGETLADVFSSTQAHVIEFDNPLQDRKATNTVYVARV
jgi:spermidine synthase